MPQLLDTIEVTAAASPGESIRVHVVLTEDAPVDTQVLISGLRAPEVWLQAPPRKGPWSIPVIVTSGNDVEQHVATVAVEGDPVAPVLEIARNPFLPLGVVIHAADLDPEHPLMTAGDIYRWRVGVTEMITGEPVIAQDLAFQVNDHEPWTTLLVQLMVEHQDGATLTVQRTLVLGSVYRLLRDELQQVRPPVSTNGEAKQTRQFNPAYRGSMQIRNLEPEGIQLTLKRIEWLVTDDELGSYGGNESIDLRIEAGSALDLDTEFDRRQAPSGAHGAILHLFGKTDGGLDVHTSAAFDFVRSNIRPDVRVPDLAGYPSILDRVAQTLEAFGGDPYVIGAITGGLVRLPENIRAGGLTQEHLWALDLLATSAGGARASNAEATPSDRRGERLRALAASIDSSASARRVPQRMMSGGETRPMPSWLVTAAARVGLHDSVLFMPDIGGVREGDSCDPDNLPDQIPEFFACQFTREYREELVPGRVVNARKGDIILVPGGNGLIGGLLAHLTPLQRYAHCGIMSKNFVEISHSTASSDWLVDNARGVDPLGSTGSTQPTDGFDPVALRFQWPGGITQSVESAYGGSEFTSAEGKKYRLAAFSLADKAFLDQQWQIIPPLVLKPHPVVEHDDPNLRKRLRHVAEEARQLCVTEADTAAGRQSKVHYRFYCYTDAALAVRPSPSGVIGPAPADAGWSAGTLPTVCSSLIWLSARKAGEHLEGPGPITQESDLEAEPDRLAGAERDDLTEDGLYLYTEAERRAAAIWLVSYLSDEIHKKAVKKSGFWAELNEFFSDLADDCAFQITNAFASDLTEGIAAIDEPLFLNPGVGRAVSPDNLMLWDKPELGGRGLWGYVEPLAYHQARVELVPVTKWRKTGGPGTVKGSVRFQGQPVPGANLDVGGTMALADGAGAFSMTVMEGLYILRASAFMSSIDAVAVKAFEVEVKHDETTTVLIDLQPPVELYRLVAIDALMAFRDDEDIVADEADSDGKYWELQVQPWDTEESVQYTYGWGGECRIEAKISAKLNFDRSVDVTLSGDLFEGASENTDERDGQGSQTWHVPKDATIEPPWFRIKSDSEDDNYAEFKLKITNRTQR